MDDLDDTDQEGAEANGSKGGGEGVDECLLDWVDVDLDAVDDFLLSGGDYVTISLTHGEVPDRHGTGGGEVYDVLTDFCGLEEGEDEEEGHP